MSSPRAPFHCQWYTLVVSLSPQVMRFRSDLSVFLTLTAVSRRERQSANFIFDVASFLNEIVPL
jgi:hypothetical protein